MSLAVIKSRALSGMDAPEVAVEVHLANGLPGFTLVGLADTEVRESRDRVRAAIQTARFEFPQRRITVNLAPAGLPKEGGSFDLPIALGMLIASGQVPGEAARELEFAGELSLTGELRPVRGALALALAAARAGRELVLPADNAAEAALAGEVTIRPARSLLEVCAHLAGAQALPRCSGAPNATLPDYPDLADVKGQPRARRALEVAAAGGHSLLMSGPPGTGKSMLAARFPGILPPMTARQAREAAAVQSVAGVFRLDGWARRRVCAPHHSASVAALVGGGSQPRPGEISLAHHGVLFLDELPEWDRRVLEALREPLESGSITVSRAARRVEFPARFQLVAAMNPCPCGYLGHPTRNCRCSPDRVASYRGRLSGPLLDRIDLHVEVPAVSEAELQQRAPGEASAAVRERVERAHALQQARQGKANARLDSAEVDALCAPDAAGDQLMRQAMARLGLSARAYHRVLKVARTVADLGGAAQVGAGHVAEAIQYRRHLAEG